MSGLPTPAELRDVFSKVLAALENGRLDGCPTGTGLDTETIAALNEFASAKGNDRAAAKANAQAELEKMLDGTHYKQEQAEAATFFADYFKKHPIK